MGETEDTLPPSKKRAAGRELTKETLGRDEDEDSGEQETGTFKKASEDVLASRRIVKVHRNPTTSNPSSNPFAGICLMNPSAPTVPATTGVTDGVGDKAVSEEANEKAEDGDEGLSGNKNNEPVAELTTEEKDNKDIETVLQDNDKNYNNVEIEDKKDETEGERDVIEGERDVIEGKKDEIEGERDETKDKEDQSNGKDDQNGDGPPLSSFQQLSSTQNAFTGLTGTGFSTSMFSFGSIPKDGSSLVTSSFSFGSSTNGNSSLFNTTGPSIVSKSETSGFSAMQEVSVETGEENEKAVFLADSILFEFFDGGWKERGKGELKVNIPATGNGKARLLMRARGNYRLILNASLYPDMKLTGMEKKGVTFACVNGTSEGKDSLSTFALKFKDPSVVEEFCVAVTAYNTTGPSIVSKSETSGFSATLEVTVETGEENEKAVFLADSILFEFFDGGWKERGKGELKVNIPATGNGKARLLMRARGNYRLILNANLYPDMKLTGMEKKGVTFACVNSTSEGKDSLSTFALKFKDPSVVEEFCVAVTAYKCGGNTTTTLRTPENSPKAADD